MIVFERGPEFEDGLSLSLHLFRPASLKRGDDFLGLILCCGSPTQFDRALPFLFSSGDLICPQHKYFQPECIPR